MIQSEAFRCKEITEKLLDFSRMGQAKRQDTELGELVQGVIDMIGHLGRYQRRRLEFARGKPVVALVNGNAATQMPVQTGFRENGRVEIQGAGLKEGDSVATVGAYGLPEQTKVQVVNP